MSSCASLSLRAILMKTMLMGVMLLRVMMVVVVITGEISAARNPEPTYSKSLPIEGSRGTQGW